ncbi:MAG: hypothetical protein R3B45_13890 [Bdellovibrionota bacterium]
MLTYSYRHGVASLCTWFFVLLAVFSCERKRKTPPVNVECNSSQEKGEDGECVDKESEEPSIHSESKNQVEECSSWQMRNTLGDCVDKDPEELTEPKDTNLEDSLGTDSGGSIDDGAGTGSGGSIDIGDGSVSGGSIDTGNDDLDGGGSAGGDGTGTADNGVTSDDTNVVNNREIVNTTTNPRYADGFGADVFDVGQGCSGTTFQSAFSDSNTLSNASNNIRLSLWMTYNDGTSTSTSSGSSTNQNTSPVVAVVQFPANIVQGISSVKFMYFCQQLSPDLLVSNSAGVFNNSLPLQVQLVFNYQNQSNQFKCKTNILRLDGRHLTDPNVVSTQPLVADAVCGAL